MSRQSRSGKTNSWNLSGYRDPFSGGKITIIIIGCPESARFRPVKTKLKKGKKRNQGQERVFHTESPSRMGVTPFCAPTNVIRVYPASRVLLAICCSRALRVLMHVLVR